MRRFTPIRITQNDRAEYARLVRNTKAKVRRTFKKYGVDLSNEINIPSIEDFKTRDQFNEFKERQQSFTNRSNLHYQFRENKYGVVANKAEILHAELETKRAQNIAKEFRDRNKDRPFISGNKQQGTVGQRAGYMKEPDYGGIRIPDDFDFEKIRSRRDLDVKINKIEKRAKRDYYDKRMGQMKTNYIFALSDQFNNIADDLIKKLSDMSGSDFFDLYLQYDMYFGDVYTVDESKAIEFVEKVDSYIDRYYSDRSNQDLKGF